MSTQTPGRRILRNSVVLSRVGVHYTTLKRWEKAGTFPRHVILGANSIGWFEDEVDAWIANRQRQSDSPSQVTADTGEAA